MYFQALEGFDVREVGLNLVDCVLSLILHTFGSVFSGIFGAFSSLFGSVFNAISCTFSIAVCRFASKFLSLLGQHARSTNDIAIFVDNFTIVADFVALEICCIAFVKLADLLAFFVEDVSVLRNLQTLQNREVDR